MESALLNYPLVSIALCTYNGAQYLREQLDSLSTQDYPNLEIVVCDDASTDETPELLRTWKEPRARLFFNESRLGYNRNFVRCFEHCRGDFIAPSDQDDRWSPDKIGRLKDALGNSDLAYCDSRFIDENGMDLGASVSDGCRMPSGCNPVKLISGNYVHGHATLFKRSLLDAAIPFPESPNYDSWLAFVAADRDGLSYLAQALVNFRRHSGAATLATRPSDSERNKFARNSARVTQLKQYAYRSRGNHRNTLARYADLMARRERQWLSPALSLFVLLNGRDLYACDLNPARVTFKRTFDLLIGLKLRRLFSPATFSEPV